MFYWWLKRDPVRPCPSSSPSWILWIGRSKRYKYMHIFIYIFICIHLYIYIFVWVCKCVYVCIHMYMLCNYPLNLLPLELYHPNLPLTLYSLKVQAIILAPSRELVTQIGLVGDDVFKVYTCLWWWWRLLKKDYNKGVTKSNPTQKCRPAKGISKRVNIQTLECGIWDTL
jgi:hypothetical protein